MKKAITEVNEIISKFIGISYDSDKELYVISNSEWGKGYDNALLHLDKTANSEDCSDGDNVLFFNSKWDLLMSVCNKWDNFFNESELIGTNYEEYMTLCDKLDDEVSCYELDEAWEQLVKNIKWYNSLK